MAYVKKVWKDYPNTTTPIVASDMNNIEDGIEDIDTRLSTTETLIGQDGSSHTTIGTNNVRATRFVSKDAPITVVNNVDPANTDWVDVDVTDQTSANAYAVIGTIFVRSTTAARAVYVRKNGTSVTGSATQTATTQVANVYATSSFQVGLDTNQIFEYAASNADINSIIIIITGYFEYVD